MTTLQVAVAEAQRFSLAVTTRFKGNEAVATGSLMVDPGSALPAILGKNAFAERQYEHFTGWTYAAIRPIAQTVAGQPIHVGRLVEEPTRGRGERFTRDMVPRFLRSRLDRIQPVEQGPLQEALVNPNHVLTDWHLKYITMASLELTGMCLWLFDLPKKGKPVIWPVPASWAVPEHEEDRPFARWVVSSGGGAEPVPFDAREVAYFFYPDPSDPKGVVSPAWAQRRAIGTDESLQDAQASAFRNALWGGLAVIAGDVVDEDGENQGKPLLEYEQRQQLYSIIKRQYAGVQNAGEPLILDALIKDVRKITSGIREMDFLNSGKTTYGRITQGFGSHPFVMGETENANRASSAVARQHFADFTVNPKIDMLSRVLTRTARQLTGDPAILIWVEPYQPDDREERRKDMELLQKAVAINRAELRRLFPQLDLEPMTSGGGQAVAPATLSLHNVPTESSGEGEVAPPTEDDEHEDDGDETAGRLSSVKGHATWYTKAEAVKMWLRSHAAREKQFQDKLLELFNRQRDEVIARLREVFGHARQYVGSTGGHGEGLTDLIFRPADWYEAFDETCRSEIQAAMVEGATQSRLLHQPKKAAPPVTEVIVQVSPEVQAAIEAEMNTIMGRPYWPEIQQTTRTKLAATLNEAMDKGENLYQMTVRIGDSPTVPTGSTGVLGSESNTIRGLLIARTECLTADTPVNGAVLTAAYRRFYQGPMFKVVTESGRELTGSPNHPMLTLRGWVPLCELTESDYLVAHRSDIQASRSSGDQNVQDGPATIGEVFDSLSAIAVFTRERSGQPDFHGDGREGDVDVLRPNGALSYGRFLPIDKCSVDGILAPADMREVVLAAKSAPFYRGLPVDQCHALRERSEGYVADGEPPADADFVDAKRFSKRSRRFTRHITGNDLIPRKVSAVAAVASREQIAAGLGERSHNVSFLQRGGDSIGTDFHGLRNGAAAHAVAVEGHRFHSLLGRQAGLQGSCFGQGTQDTGFPAKLVDPGSAMADRVADLGTTHAGYVEVDRVLNLVLVPNWSGHVYNLTTVHGYFTAAGLYTGNTTGSLNAGHYIQSRQLEQENLVDGREWSTTIDQYTRDSHTQAHGQRVKGSQMFRLGKQSGGEEMTPYPGHHDLSAGNRVNCRCVAVSVHENV